MRSKAILSPAVLLGMALLSSRATARAQGPEGGPRSGFRRPEAMEHRMEMSHRHMEMMPALELSREQRERIADLREKHERAAIRMRADLETARLDLKRLTHAEKADRMAINRQIDRMAQMRAEMEKARIGLMLDVRGTLTPEQQDRMREPGGRRSD